MNTLLAKAIRARFNISDPQEIERMAGQLTLKELMGLKGVGERTVIQYAIDSGRLVELERIRSSLSDPSALEGMQLQFQTAVLRDRFEIDERNPNDEQNINALAHYYILRARLLSEAMDADAGSSKNKGSAMELQRINSSILELERHLGIDPETRARATADEEVAEVLSDLVHTSVDFLAEEGSIHKTKHAAAGLTIWFFHAKEYEPHCGECGSHNLVFTSPYDEEEYPFAVSTPAQQEQYVMGRDWQPSDLPSDYPQFAAQMREMQSVISQWMDTPDGED